MQKNVYEGSLVMEARIWVTLDRDEVERNIPYALVCETRFGSGWNTGRTRRRWLSEFSEKERDAAGGLFSQAHKWYLVTGVPEKVKISARTLALWTKLGEFCCSL